MNAYRALVRERDGCKCRRCGSRGSKKNPLTIHHIKPRCRGGTNVLSNLKLLCSICHKKTHLGGVL